MPQEDTDPRQDAQARDAQASPHIFDDGQCDRCGCTEDFEHADCPGPIEGQPRRCVVDGCTNAVACFGSYEGSPEGYACDEHCGHGCEDGNCWPVPGLTPAEGAAQAVIDLVDRVGVVEATAALHELAATIDAEGEQ